MKIVLLGTSSAVPTLTRGLSSTALIREGDIFLFDCGEGTQLQLMRSGVKRSRIHSIFIGHLHGDHLYGIAGLLSTLHLDGRETPLNVFGPEGLRNFLNASFRSADLQFSFKLTVQEFPRGYRGRVLDEEEFYVDALPLEHSIFCLGWRFQEKPKPGVFNLDRAQELGIPRGPLYGKLQHGESVKLEDGQVITPDMVLGDTRQGKSVVYCLDTQFSERSIQLADKCTVLIHETTFGPDAIDMARERKHSTMEDAARVAKEAKAESLIATHFSSRYDGRQIVQIRDEARSVFENITSGRDLLEIEI
ncbi:MAG TPA: ribonuclease Z [Terriglobia bacterium]|nr:ribonuclease Z [Terriglobia bacterium]